jgi:hypothetical protein
MRRRKMQLDDAAFLPGKVFRGRGQGCLGNETAHGKNGEKRKTEDYRKVTE